MRYIPNTDADRAAMLEAIGTSSIDKLFADIPAHLRRPSLNLPPALSEMQLKRLMAELAARNTTTASAACFLGAGAYHHFVPSVVHHITGRSEFYTSYTPYQAEASQGTLQTIFEYQTAICQLTGMDVANASMYDGATAAAEAAILAQGVTRRRKVVVSPAIQPDYLAVLKTYTAELGSDIATNWCLDDCLREGQTDPVAAEAVLDQDTACLLVQHPNFFGALEPMDRLAAAAHRVGALLVAIVDPISLGLLKPPGAYDADVAVAEGQPLGNSLAFGGPYLGIFASKESLVRHMPGRIVGQTTDGFGRRGFVLTLQAREQHIRREKATSNICTNEALNALAALVYLSAMGKQGLHRVAELCVQKSHHAAERIAALPGYSLAFAAPFFKEFVVRCPRSAADVNAHLLKHNIVGGYDLAAIDARLADCMLLCVTEMNTREEIDCLVEALKSL
ncbi:MAG: aminomethyl-transferring glycine dehydrogenase subunit GcvPA [Chloroflexi bacterium]|nr:aminomethyl-transferring glycine dehydrogenase subunit GcvPA [Chloroflexota bacterium]